MAREKKAMRMLLFDGEGRLVEQQEDEGSRRITNSRQAGRHSGETALTTSRSSGGLTDKHGEVSRVDPERSEYTLPGKGEDGWLLPAGRLFSLLTHIQQHMRGPGDLENGESIQRGKHSMQYSLRHSRQKIILF